MSFKCGWFQRGVEAFTAAVRRSPSDPQIYYNLGRAAELYGPPDDARFWQATVEPNMTLAKTLAAASFRRWFCSSRIRAAMGEDQACAPSLQVQSLPPGTASGGCARQCPRV